MGRSLKNSPDHVLPMTSISEIVIVPELKHLGLLEEPEVFINSLQVFLDRYWRSLPL